MPDAAPQKSCCTPVAACFYGLFAVAFFALMLLFVSRALTDPDFWWHLKTGELMVRGRALLAADPFNFTGDPATVTLRERMILQGYWLWQVVAYGFYRLGEFAGIKLLGGLTLLATYAAVGRSLLRSRVRPEVALPLLAVSLYLYFRFYPLERPQVISFLCAAVLVGFLVAVRRGERPSWLLYPLMAVWANMHGGVIVGAVLLILFAAGSAWDLRGEPARLRAIAWWCGGGILASFVNPVGLDYYWGTLELMNRGMTEGVTEFRSSFWVFSYGTKAIAWLWLLLAVHFAALGRDGRRGSAAEWLVSLFLAVGGVLYMRNVAFAAVALLPLTACAVERALAALPAVRGPRFRSAGPAAAGLAIVLLGYACVDAWRWRGEEAVNQDSVPRELAEFLDRVPLEGNLFNEYTWGGYLLWKLHPKYRLFIDGRAIDERAYGDYFTISGASLRDAGGTPEYKRLIDDYRIDYVAMHNQMEFGLVQKLLKYLLADREWVPIYLDASGFVLARSTAATRPVIDRHRIAKKAFLDQLLGYYNQALQAAPQRADFYLGRGELLGYIGRYDEAARDFATVRQLDPGHPFLDDKISQLQKLREKTGQ
ncbi:MAG: hypothetical protein FDZ69_12525 [Deltaproteobacteria bacterium]|nr:MAG: hypothetical protein FDZ69_12525 [Deltaproteobacteria bacterium]